MPDWPDVVDSYPTLQSYFALVDELLRAASLGQWLSDVRRHKAPVDYASILGVPCTHLRDAWKCGLPWDLLVGQRSLARLRAGLLRLGHRRGRRSSARHQSCICCDREIEDTAWHVIFECSGINADLRSALADAMTDGSEGLSATEALSTVLLLPVDSPAYPAVIALSSCIEEVSRNFWRDKGRCHLD